MTRRRLACALLALAACRGHDHRRDTPPPVDLLPGAPPVKARLAAEIREAAALRDGEVPHTRHLDADGAPRYANRLALEASPYLRQHAHNPVNWFPWGDDAFREALRLDRPILLSIGYSTCHWCHVMARESFDDVATATYLNENYVAIKVDREERPDVDAIYLEALRALGKPGGWPLTIWLTAEGKPYFGATYLPPGDGQGSFLGVLRRGRELHDTERARLDESGDALIAAMQQRAAVTPGDGAPDDAAPIDQALASYRERFDAEEGGLRQPGARTKFPADLPLRLLLRAARRGAAEAEPMAVLTLERMAAGGLRDHVGGGFHRYSTDARWLVPHFEKMLYDNALLAVAYLEAHQATGRVDFAAVARETVDFVLRELAEPGGGFHAALDADSAAPGGATVEGAYYTWTPGEVEAAVGADDAPLVRAWFGVSEAGNLDGRTVLATPRPLAEVAATLGLTEAAARAALDRARSELASARARRPRPHRDEKIIAAWNGLMVTALVRAALVLDRGATDSPYLAAARRTAELLHEKLVRPDGRIARALIGGVAHGDGVLDDHAALLAADLDLFEATGETAWLDRALALDAALARDFEDAAGGFFLTAVGAELLLRQKPLEDGALPSGNALAARNLDRLAALTGQARFRERADRLWRALSGALRERPTAMPDLLLALDARLHPGPEIVLVAPAALEELAPFRAALAARLVPGHVTVPVRAGDVAALAARVPLVESKLALRGAPTAFVCRERVCRLPATDAATFAQQLTDD